MIKMKNIRRAVTTVALAIAVSGLASAGTISESFSLPGSGSQATNWGLNGTTQSFDYLQSLNPTVIGSLAGITISYTWASTGVGSGVDNSSGTVSYVFESDTITNISANGLTTGQLLLHESTLAAQFPQNPNPATNGSGCVDTQFTNETSGSIMIEPGCVDSSALEAASGNDDGARLSQSFTSSNAAVYAFFEGTATPNDLSFLGTAATNDVIGGGPVTATQLGGLASETVTVQYSYNAVFTGVPEPATLFLMGSALVGVGLLRKRAKQ
jgi:hypothetical protein